MYPLELHVIAYGVESLPPGVHHYAVIGHCLEEMRAVPSVEELSRAILDQPHLAAAPVFLVVTAVVDRLLSKYGDRGYRYLLLEAGHVLQNLNLAAVALGLASCNVGGFLDLELSSLIGIDGEEEIPLYACALGHPPPGDRRFLRSADVQRHRPSAW